MEPCGVCARKVATRKAQMVRCVVAPTPKATSLPPWTNAYRHIAVDLYGAAPGKAAPAGAAGGLSLSELKTSRRCCRQRVAMRL